MREDSMETTKFIAQWSAISPGDLGLRAAYWNGKAGDPVTFRAIVGWISFNAKEASSPKDAPSENGFAPVVIDDRWFPRLAGQISNHVGVVPKDMRDEDVQKRVEDWDARRQGAPVEINSPERAPD
jgi:hypothetical protein